MKKNTTNKNRELERMMSWAKMLDVMIRICGAVVQIGSGLGAVMLIAFHFFAIVPSDRAEMNLTVLGRHIKFASLSAAGQTAVVILMAVVCLLAIPMMRDLTRALHNVFQPMACGRPFEEEAVKGFGRAAVWCAVIGVLALNGYVLVIAALLLLLSYVFHYGSVLQTESDETL